MMSPIGAKHPFARCKAVGVKPTCRLNAGVLNLMPWSCKLLGARVSSRHLSDLKELADNVCSWGKNRLPA